MTKKTFPNLCVDFDGVIHDYKQGWQGPTIITGDIVPGAAKWLAEMTEHYTVNIVSTRSFVAGGRRAMQDALRKWLSHSPELPEEGRFTRALEICDRIQWPDSKPPSMLYIDDRAFCFEGEFPSREYIKKFKPWFKRHE